MKPKECDLCNRPFQDGDVVIDGATKMGPWGYMCIKCHMMCGRGLGIGRGQSYDWETGTQLAGGSKTGKVVL